jgi:hypothetical protein
MAEKHKSKYKAPKDLEKSQKPKPRKDLKDYTEDDKKGAMNPKSTGEKQSNVLRKTDKEVVDTGDVFVKYNADDRLYKDLEDGEYDPKHAAKVLKKRQDADEKDNEKNIKDKIENLTREQREVFKERLIREYIRKKIFAILTEADETEETPETPETPEDIVTEPAPAPATEPAPASATEPAPASPAPPADSSTSTTPPTATPDQQETPSATTAAGSELENENTIRKVDGILNILRVATKNSDLPEQLKAYKILRWKLGKKIMQLHGKQQNASNETDSE